MGEANNTSALRIGLLLVAITWFMFTGFQFIKGAFNIFRDPARLFWVSLTDTAGTFGLGFRTMAALIAVLTILFFVVRKDLSKPELTMSVRWIILGEAVAMLALFPVVIWSIALATGTAISNVGLGSFIESTLPVFIESVIIPIALIKLFLELNPKKTSNGIIKWSLITGTIYVFMFWINNTGNWIGAIEERGAAIARDLYPNQVLTSGQIFSTGIERYVLAYPDHIISLVLTVGGLLALAIYMAYFTKKNIGAKSIYQIDLRKIGAIITALGLYFLIIYVMWLFVGTVDKWSSWYAWFLGHNMDLWILSLPLAGIPLLFSAPPSKKAQE